MYAVTRTKTSFPDIMMYIRGEDMKTTKAQLKATAKYQAANTKAYVIRLNLNTDADIIQKLEQVDNKQGYIKSLIRSDLNSDLTE